MNPAAPLSSLAAGTLALVPQGPVAYQSGAKEHLDGMTQPTGTPAALENAPVRADDPASAAAARPPLGRSSGWRGALAALDRLPPIQLPLGPPIPWRYGLSAFVALAILSLLLLGRPTPDTRLAQSNMPVAAATASGLSDSAGGGTSAAPLGGGDALSPGIDPWDLAWKLLLVLALAYGSLRVLQRMGYGGAVAGGLPAGEGMRVLATLTLAPNRSVHLLRLPGGRTLLLGATPTRVNLLSDLGQLPHDQAVPEPASFLQILNSKLPRD